MKSVLVDERISAVCCRALEIRGFYPIMLPRHPRLGEAIASHPDSLIFFADGELFSPAEYCDVAPWVFTDIRERHPNVKIRFTSDELSEKYPNDCKMNAKLFGKKLLAREDTLSPAIKDFALKKGYKIINTKQGYPACTTLAPNGESAVTADKGIYDTLTKSGIQTALIENGCISLPPHEYGFIGGASGVFENEVYFIGNYKTHPSADIIEKALWQQGCTPVSLSNEPLADLGGLIFLE